MKKMQLLIVISCLTFSCQVKDKKEPHDKKMEVQTISSPQEPLNACPGEKELDGRSGFGKVDVQKLFTYPFNPSEVQTIHGTVGQFLSVRGPGDDCYGLVILLGNDGNYFIDLAPLWFLDQNGLFFEEGDALSVTGTKYGADGVYFLISSKIQKGENTVLLRNSEGMPLWQPI